jgi:hypothetical protein
MNAINNGLRIIDLENALRCVRDAQRVINESFKLNPLTNEFAIPLTPMALKLVEALHAAQGNLINGIDPDFARESEWFEKL